MDVIIVGLANTSINKISAEKLGAARMALSRYRERTNRACMTDIFMPVGTPPPIPSQPMGTAEMRLGAYHRARCGLNDKRVTHGLGMENGLLATGEGEWIDLALVLILPRDTMVPIIVSSAGVPCPAWAVNASLACGRQQTAGHFIAERTCLNGTNWHSGSLGGMLDRTDLLSEAVFQALLLTFMSQVPMDL